MVAPASQNFGGGNYFSPSVSAEGSTTPNETVCVIGAPRDNNIYMIREIYAGFWLFNPATGGFGQDYQSPTAGWRSPVLRLRILRAKSLPDLSKSTAIISSGNVVAADRSKFDTLFDQIIYDWKTYVTFFAEDKNQNPDNEVYSATSTAGNPLLVVVEGGAWNITAGAFESTQANPKITTYANVHAVQLNGPDRSPKVAGNYRLGD